MTNSPDQPVSNPGTVLAGSVAPTTAAETRPDEVNAVRAGADRSHYINEVVQKWSNQQDSDRQLRWVYAGVLIGILLLQVITVNVAFFKIGGGTLKVDEWTARVFIMSVFGELAAMVFFIVKYLFRSTGDDIIKEVGKIAAEAVPRPVHR